MLKSRSNFRFFLNKKNIQNALTLIFPTGDYINHFFRMNPLNQVFRHPNIKFYTNNLILHYWKGVRHTVPALLLDLALRLTGQKPW